MLPAVVLAAAGLGALSTVRARRRRTRKPQQSFRVHVANNSQAPFQHWQPSAAQQPTNQAQQHPYGDVIARLSRSPPLPEPLPDGPDQLPPPLAETPLVLVSDVRALRQLAAELQGVRRFAVDTEHNALRSYLGLSCLLQLSIGVKDWIVDVLALHDHMHLLHSAFADPSIVKVLHGGASDVVWLQRDFHLYLVNVFDTERASAVLGREERSLAHLLRRYCGVQQDKAYQRADWRVRPLSPQLLHYARGDVHWLLYLAECLTAELVKGSAWVSPAAADGGDDSQGAAAAPADDYPSLATALRKSHAISAQLYRKPEGTITAVASALFKRYCSQHAPPDLVASSNDIASGSAPVQNAAAGSRSAGSSSEDEQGCTDSSGKCGKAAGRELMLVRDAIWALAAWRDAVARKEDESPQYVLPDAALLELARTRPGSTKQMLSIVERWTRQLDCARAAAPFMPDWQVSAALRKRRKEVLQLWSAAGPGIQHNPLPAAGSDGVLSAGQPLLRSKGGRSEAEEQEFVERMITKFAAKSQVYQNCRMLSQEGQLLCFCDEKKLRWYVDKGLADLVTEDPPTIKLRFEHKTTDQAVGADGFYSRAKANRCVVCGEESHFLRYRILPTCYRRCYPMHLKSHRSHDIVLLCIHCHTVAHKASERLKRQLAREYGVPLNAPKPTGPQAPAQETGTPEQQREQIEEDEDQERQATAVFGSVSTSAATAAAGVDSDKAAESGLPSTSQSSTSMEISSTSTVAADGAPVSAFQARAAAVALQRFGDTIPEHRRAQLEGQIRSYLGRDAGGGSGSEVLLPADVQAALLAGLTKRKRAWLCRKMELTPTEVEAAEDAAAAASTGEASSTCAGVGGRQLPGEGEPGGSGHAWHGERLVAKALAGGGEEELLGLIRRFRQCFVDSTKPQYLPTDWSVHVVAKREFGNRSVYHAPAHEGLSGGQEQSALQPEPRHERQQQQQQQQQQQAPKQQQQQDSLQSGPWPAFQA